MEKHPIIKQEEKGAKRWSDQWSNDLTVRLRVSDRTILRYFWIDSNSYHFEFVLPELYIVLIKITEENRFYPDNGSNGNQKLRLGQVEGKTPDHHRFSCRPAPSSKNRRISVTHFQFH